MSETWTACKVEDIASQNPRALAMGPFGSRITKDNFVAQGVPVIRGVNISSGRFYPYDFVYLEDSKADELIASVAFPDDLVFTHRGTLGQVGIVPKHPHPRYIVSQSQMKLTCDRSLAWPLFMFYYFSSKGKTDLLKHVSGSGVPAIASPLSTLRNIKIHIPPLMTQQKIAAILSVYDDLIENNLRRIKILEEMAQNLYREWFVNFRFPGHEKARFVDSPLGRIPEGWEVVQVGELLEKLKKVVKVPRSNYATNGRWPVIDQGKDFIGGYTDDKESIISSELPLIVFGDHTRVLKYIDFPFARGADGTQLLKSNNERMPMSLFYYSLLAVDLSNYAYTRHFKFLKDEKMLLPDKAIAEAFDQFLTSMLDNNKKLMEKNVTLRQTRNLLLPKLISGEVDVSELDIKTEEEVAV